MYSKKTILIVDDDFLIISILRDKIERKIKNINILTALSYKEAIKHILDKTQNIDVAILDLNLPEVESGAVVDYAMKKNIPTIVLTATINESLKKILIKNNIIDYILKNGKRGIDHAVDCALRILKHQGTNILLVDDAIVDLTLISDVLKKMKFNVITAKNGLEAYGILQNSDVKFSLIITDYNMPKMDGMALILKIREDFDKDELAIIALSGYEDEELSSHLISVGANDFLTKPYSDIELITRISSNLELLDLFQKTKDMANKDFLTGAYNRRYFFDQGEIIFKKAKKQKTNLVVAMFDIDKFKNINDTYGHDIGDVAIIEVANILNKYLDDSALMARFGGEEFCVLLENTTLDEAKILFENIRKAFEKNIIDINDLKIQFTTSIGICYGVFDTLDIMIKKADDGLYTCKNNGRNQISICPDSI